MPLVRISVLKGKSREYRRKVGDAVHRALVEAIAVPEKDRFQIITDHWPDEFVYDPEYLGIRRSEDLVIIQATISTGRTLEMKRALFRRIAANLGDAVGLKPEAVQVHVPFCPTAHAPLPPFAHGFVLVQSVQ